MDFRQRQESQESSSTQEPLTKSPIDMSRLWAQKTEELHAKKGPLVDNSITYLRDDLEERQLASQSENSLKAEKRKQQEAGSSHQGDVPKKARILDLNHSPQSSDS